MLGGMFDGLVRSFVKDGTLELKMPDGHTIVAGQGDPVIRAAIHDPAVPARIMRNPDLGLGEAYMDGKFTIENDDIRGLLTLFVVNLRRGNSHWIFEANQNIGRRLRWMAQKNVLPRARSNVAHHYDLSRELYDIFLDADRQYSCAYFRRDDDTLEQAQEQKKQHIAKKLLLEPDMEVLDIGCGWGGMALTLARDHGVKVTGVTLSEEQHELANHRVREAGLQDRIDIRLQDYRDIDRTFDRIVSVGMFEHVGVPHYDEYFGKVREMLDEDGVALIHTIGRTGPPGITSPFIAKWIFPGGYVPALSEMQAAVERQTLELTDLEVWRMHYAKTLQHWEQRFTAGIERARELYDDRFCRMWRYYLIGCEVTFEHGRQVVFQAQLTRKKRAVPITRDYMCD